jgi:hypothetical protein
MKKLIIACTAALLLSILLTSTTQSIPAFARKHGFNCNMCHVAFTELSDFGERVRDNGYQIPGQEGREKNVFEIAPPIALRTSTGMIVAHSQTPKETTSGFHVNGLDLLSAGVLHKNISFLLIYTPRIDEPSADFTGSADGTNPSQLGALESANIVFSNLVPHVLNLRIGRFEPAYHPFSSKRSYYLLQPYEVYAFATPGNNFVFDDNQIGIEASGHLREGFRYAAGVVNGSGASPDNNTAKDFYINCFQMFGRRGEGLSSGQRIGGFAYYGWQPTRQPLVAGPEGDADGKGNKPFYRLGGDAALNWRTASLKALFMYGVDNRELTGWVYADDYSFTGGFVRLDWASLMNNRLVTSAMFNWVTPPAEDDVNTVRAFSTLVRYYLGDWTAVNIALHGEYTYRQVGAHNPDKQHRFAALLDFAF